MGEFLHKKRQMNSFQFIILGFAAVIVIGALILMLPVSSRSVVHSHFRRMRYGTCGGGYRKSLVCFRAVGYSNNDSNRRLGSGDRGGVIRTAFGQENIPYAKKHYARGDSGSENGRHSAAYGIYIEDDLCV